MYLQWLSFFQSYFDNLLIAHFVDCHFDFIIGDKKSFYKWEVYKQINEFSYNVKIYFILDPCIHEFEKFNTDNDPCIFQWC